MEEIKQIIRSIAISGASNTLSVKDLARDFKKMEGFDLPFQRLGFRSVDQFLHSLTDTVKVNGYGPMAHVEPIVTQSNRHIRELVQAAKTSGKRRPKQGYNKSSYRPRTDYSYNNHEKSYGYSHSSANKRVPTDDYYNPNMEPRKIKNPEFDYYDPSLSNDNESDESSDGQPQFTMTNSNKLEQVVVPSEVPKCNPYPEKSRRDEAIPDDAGLLLIHSLEVPKDAMNLGDSVEMAKVPETVVPKQSVRVFVTEVHNPNRIWYHMGESAETIDELMNEIEAFYSHLGREEWRMKEANVVDGLYCVAKYLGLWHRAKLVSEFTHNKVKVFYIDYGTVAELELKDVKYMAKCFAKMPAQAMRASLAYIKPVNHRWTRDAAWSMLSLVYEKILYAYVVDIDRKENVIDIVLIDTSGAQDVNVNQQLFVKGHAIWEDDMPYKDKNTENYRNRTKMFCEMFPRFEEIENGTYPSLLEIGEFHSEGFNFDRYYTQSMRDDCEYLQQVLKRTFTISSKLLIDKDTVQSAWYIEEESLQQSINEDYVQQNVYDVLSPEKFSIADGIINDSPPQDDLKPQVVPEMKAKKKKVRFMEPEKELDQVVVEEELRDPTTTKQRTRAKLDEKQPLLDFCHDSIFLTA